VSAAITPLRPRARFSLLVVESDPITRLLVSDALRAAGYRVLEASSGSDAQAVLTGMPVHGVVLNSRLGDSLDGSGILQLAADLRPPPKLILTDRVFAEEDAVEGHLVRTDGATTPSRLVELIRETLDPTGAAGL
jgi:DNA-binding response OmpR family regulator